MFTPHLFHSYNYRCADLRHKIFYDLIIFLDETTKQYVKKNWLDPVSMFMFRHNKPIISYIFRYYSGRGYSKC